MTSSGSWHRGAIFIVMVVASGCVPARFSGYEPQGPGTREPEICVAGVHTRLLVEAPHGVGVHWQADRDDVGNSLLLHVYLTVPTGVSVRLLTPELELRSASWPEPRTLTVAAVSAPGPHTLAPEAEIIGPTDPDWGYYALSFFPKEAGSFGRTNIPAVPEFSVTLPALSINGQPWQADAVTFNRYSRWGVYTCVQ